MYIHVSVSNLMLAVLEFLSLFSSSALSSCSSPSFIHYILSCLIYEVIIWPCAYANYNMSIGPAHTLYHLLCTKISEILIYQHIGFNDKLAYFRHYNCNTIFKKCMIALFCISFRWSSNSHKVVEAN